MIGANQLNILYAAYGPKDSTQIVRSHVQNNCLSIQASNYVFGDPWEHTFKSLIVIYQYGNCKPFIGTVQEGGTLTITPMDENQAPWEDNEPGKLKIICAAFGINDVTEEMISRIQDNQIYLKLTGDSFDIGGKWNSIQKTFVIAFQYYPGQPRIILKKQNEELFISDAPELKIIKAAYGLKDVTEIVRKLVSVQGGSSLKVFANNHVFSDTWVGIPKSLVVVYQFGNGSHEMLIESEGNELTIVSPVQLQSVKQSPLKIFKAAYGLKDVTDIVQNLVSKQGGCTLDVNACNSIFSDSWHGVQKSLVVVYQYGDGLPEVAVQREGSKLSIANKGKPGKLIPCKDDQKLQILGAAYGLKDVTQRCQDQVKDNSFQVDASNSVFGDSWSNMRKSLVVVYRYGNGEPKIKITPEIMQEYITNPPIKL